MLHPALLAFVLAATSPQAQLTRPTPAEIEAWKKDDETPLEISPCKRVTWMLERKEGGETIRLALGWWGRGYVLGAFSVLDDKAVEKARGFDLAVNDIARNIAAYCYQNPTENPTQAIQALLVKILK